MNKGAQPGNINATKGALYNSALKRALARAGKNVDGGLNKVCDQLVKAAIAGEQWAVKEVADRMDGRPAQALNIEAQIDQIVTQTHDRPKADKEEWLKLHGIKETG